LSGEKQGELSEESFPLHPLKDFYGEAQPYGCTSHFFCGKAGKAGKAGKTELRIFLWEGGELHFFDLQA